MKQGDALKGASMLRSITWTDISGPFQLGWGDVRIRGAVIFIRDKKIKFKNKIDFFLWLKVL